MENDELKNSIREAHFHEQMEAATHNSAEIHSDAINILKEQAGYVPVDKQRNRNDLIKGYLFEEWTWITTLEQKVANDEDVIAPDRCEHIDVMHPTVWVGLLSKPNHLLCMDCALDYANADIATGQEICDRCHQSNIGGEFYEFMMPLMNIQIMGSICKSCLDKV